MGSDECGIFDLEAWQIGSLKVSAVRSDRLASVRGSATLVPCNSTTWVVSRIFKNVSMKGTVSYQFDGEKISFGLNEDDFEVSPRTVRLAKGKVYKWLNNKLKDLKISAYGSLPPTLARYVRELSPSIDRFSLQLERNTLQFSAEMSAELSSDVASAELKIGTGGLSVQGMASIIKPYLPK